MVTAEASEAIGNLEMAWDIVGILSSVSMFPSSASLISKGDAYKATNSANDELQYLKNQPISAEKIETKPDLFHANNSITEP